MRVIISIDNTQRVGLKLIASLLTILQVRLRPQAHPDVEELQLGAREKVKNVRCSRQNVVHLATSKVIEHAPAALQSRAGVARQDIVVAFLTRTQHE